MEAEFGFSVQHVFMKSHGRMVGYHGTLKLIIFLYQTLHTAMDRCLEHFKWKKLSKCHIVTSYLMTSQKRVMQFF